MSSSLPIMVDLVASMQSCDGVAALCRQTLRLLDDFIGYDGAICFSVDGTTPEATVAAPGDATALAESLRPHLPAIDASGGIGLKLFADGITRLVGAISFRDALFGGVALWRRGAFHNQACDRMRDALPVLGMAWGALRRAEPVASADSDQQLDRFRGLFPTLSARERQIARCIALGWRNRDIATVLGISQNTVRNHTVRIFEKTEASGRTELAVWLQRAGLVEERENATEHLGVAP
jgi:DNA-binding CsgD family transcriptional regulator